MIHDLEPQTRRAAMMAALAAAGAVAAISTRADAEPPAGGPGPGLTGHEHAGHEHDWDWLVGRWSVRHSRLKGRLVGSAEWEAFNGTSMTWLTLGGLGTVDDNVLEIPSGTYRAMGFRSFDPKAEQWSIWWLDGRDPTVIEPPVKGGFKDGIGTFVGDDVLNGRPIKMRFTWSAITPTSAHWEQAFSPDGGVTWEVNWRMEFRRAA